MQQIKVWCSAVMVVATVTSMAAGERWPGTRLLVTPQALADVPAKVANHPWAKQLLDDMLAEADRWVGRPVDPPTTGGGWPHNYVCPKDAGRLEFREDSPHRHWCPRCKTFYEGEKLDAVWINSRHMNFAVAAEICGLAYRLGGRTDCADWSRRVLLWYAEKYESFPINGEWAGRGRVTCQSLDEAVWLIHMADAFDLIADHLSDADQETIITRLFLPAARHIEQYRFGVHNIECWQAAARLMAALIGRDDALRDRAIESLRKNIEAGITDEGMWFEGAPAYHTYTMMGLTPALLTARHNGIDLGPTDKLRGMYTVLSHLALPGWQIPALNDGGQTSLASMAYFLETGSYLFDDAELKQQLAWIYQSKLGSRTKVSIRQNPLVLLYGPAELPTKASLDLGSRLLKDTGLAVLRHGGYTAIVKAGRKSGWHDHADRCQLILADEKQTWFDDLGTSSYGHPLYLDWYRHTASHCTVMVDGKPQATDAMGEFVRFETAGNCPTITVRCGDAYPGIVLTRTVAIVDGLVLDRFEASSDTEHEYAFLLNAPGEFTCNIKPAGGDSGTSSHLKLGSESLAALAANANLLNGDWKEASGRLGITASASSAFTAYTGHVPGFPGGQQRSALALVVRGQRAVFTAAYVSDSGTDGAGNARCTEVSVSESGEAIFKTASGKTHVLH